MVQIAPFPLVFEAVLLLLAYLNPILSQTIDQCGPDIYCTPTSGETWTIDEEFTVRWNSKFPSFINAGYVDVRLYDLFDTRTPVKEWIKVANGDGTLGFRPTRELFDRDSPDTEVTRSFRFYIDVSGNSLDTQRFGPIFNIFAPADPTTTEEPSSTVTSTQTLVTTQVVKDDQQSKSKELSPGAIAGIAIGGASALLLALIAILLLWRRRQKPKKSGYGDLHEEANPSLATLPSHSVQTTKSPRRSETRFDNQSNDQITEPNNSSGHLKSNRSLSQSDALLIADAYRQQLRKASFSSSNSFHDNEDYEEMNEKENKEAELEWRKAVSAERMKDVLQEEGTGIKVINLQTAKLENIEEDK